MLTVDNFFKLKRFEPNLAVSATRMHNCNYSRSKYKNLRTGPQGQVMPSTGHSKYVTTFITACRPRKRECGACHISPLAWYRRGQPD
jgi:hypothetical protein